MKRPDKLDMLGLAAYCVLAGISFGVWMKSANAGVFVAAVAYIPFLALFLFVHKDDD